MVVILLATYNGAAFLTDLLEGFLTETHPNWVLLWRDDGSTVETVAIIEAFAAHNGHCVQVGEPAGRVGRTASFLALLRAVHLTLSNDDIVAFSDQDDVWLPIKLARGVAALGAVRSNSPALYCARYHLVDATLDRIGTSTRLGRVPTFPAALAQNIAADCTIILNRSGAALIAASTVPLAAYHDWWCYILVAAAGGTCLHNDTAMMPYRQHDGNTVGASLSTVRHGLAARRRGPAVVLGLLRANLEALSSNQRILSAQASHDVQRLQDALRHGRLWRLIVLWRLGLYWQTPWETLLFYRCFLLLGPDGMDDHRDSVMYLQVDDHASPNQEAPQSTTCLGSSHCAYVECGPRG